jgi:periplasmic copper chaperone A
MSLARGLSAGVVLALLASSAHSHVVFDVPKTGAGELTLAALRVSHGCDGSPTKQIEVTIPEGVTRVIPRAASGWTVSTQTRRLATPITLHGRQVSEVTSKIIWTGGQLPDLLYEEFEFRFAAPRAPGQVLYFPVQQTCEQGSTNWQAVPRAGQKWEDLTNPAPFIAIEDARRPAGH